MSIYMINFGKNPSNTDLMLLDYLSKTGNDLAKSLSIFTQINGNTSKPSTESIQKHLTTSSKPSQNTSKSTNKYVTNMKMKRLFKGF